MKWLVLFLILNVNYAVAEENTFKIGVVDSGVEVSHSLIKEYLEIIDLPSQVFLKDKVSLADTNGHGTHVSGIIVKSLPKNLKFKIVPFKNIDGDEKKSELCLDDMGAESIINFAIAHQIKVLNFSQVMMIYSSKAEEAFKKALDHGILIVAASGNGEKLGSVKIHKLNLNSLEDAYNSLKVKHPEIERFNAYPCAYDLENVICVGNYLKKGWLFPNREVESNYGKTIVDVFAQGEEIKSSCLNNTFCKMSGSSMATARITAEAVKIWSRNNNLTPKEVKDQLINSLPQAEDLKPYSLKGSYLD